MFIQVDHWQYVHHLNFHLLFAHCRILSVICCVTKPYIFQTTGGAAGALNLPVSGGPSFIKHTLPPACLLVCFT